MLINDLNDDCIRSILEQLALSRQLPLRAVCSRWRALIESNCFVRTKLKLFFKSDDLVSYCKDIQKYNIQRDSDFQLKLCSSGVDLDDVLVIPNSSYPVTGRFLADLFPKVVNLVYCLYNWDTLVYLLNRWSPTLQTLSVLDMLPDSGPKKRRTFAAIDSLSSLRRLH